MKIRIDVTREQFDKYCYDDIGDNVAIVVTGDSWRCCGMTCTTKSAKIAINRFFKAVPELSEWKTMIKDAVENGCYGAMGTLDYGEKDFGWGVEMDNANGDEPTVYIYLNVKEEG